MRATARRGIAALLTTCLLLALTSALAWADEPTLEGGDAVPTAAPDAKAGFGGGLALL